jgi:tetratricopeptide (TPR) repeat protein
MPSVAITDRLSRSLVGLAVLFVSLSFAPVFVPTAAAQDKDEETAKKVLEVIRDGNEEFDAENYEAAYKKYERAYEMYPDPAILVRLGKTAEKLGQNKKAAAHFREFSRLMPDDPASEKLAKRAAELEASAPAVVAVSSEPPGAEVFVDVADGESVGTTPTDVELGPGTHTLYFKREGFEPATKKVEIDSTDSQKVSVTLSRAMISDSGDGSVAPIERDEASTVSTVGWASLGLGVASLATSGVFLYLKSDAEDEVNNYDKRAPGASRQELEELKDNANSHYDTALVTGIAGGVFTATGVGLLTYHYLTVEDDDDVALNVGAGFDAEGAWLGLNGRF